MTAVRVATNSPVYLIDTNAIIESVRVGVWNALTGGLPLETVEECADECRRGDTFADGYISVSDADLRRTSAIHQVSESDRAALLLQTDVSSLDQGELDLHAHALTRSDSNWLICSPDGAAVKIGVALGWQDRLVPLEQLVDSVGARPRLGLRQHFRTHWLSRQRTAALLGT